MKAIWKDINDWPYEVSDSGQVRNCRTGYILKPCGDSNGYSIVTLCNLGKQVTRTVHRLVSCAFFGPRPKDLFVNHKDGKKHNNNTENLEYVTRAENEKHASIMGLKARGERSNKAKLTERDVRDIRVLYDSGRTQARLGGMYNMSQAGIGYIVNRINWKHVI